jgi:hypothetical protein
MKWAEEAAAVDTGCDHLLAEGAKLQRAAADEFAPTTSAQRGAAPKPVSRWSDPVVPAALKTKCLARRNQSFF